MVVSVHEYRHDQAATGIDCAVHGVSARGEVADIDNVVALNVNVAIFDKTIVVIERDKVAIGNQQGRKH